jgi:hypothetical protein
MACSIVYVSSIYVAEEPLQEMLTIIQSDNVIKAVLSCYPENILVKEMLAALKYCFSFAV